MKYLNIPCPVCGGLLDAERVQCRSCQRVWRDQRRVCGAGYTASLEQFAETVKTPEGGAVGWLQKLIDQLHRADRYLEELEKS